MNEPAPAIAPRLRIAGIILIVGLLVIIVSLVWESPLSFLMFAAIGGLFIFAGIALYLLSLVSLDSEAP
jgi:hypothetical protein